MDRIKQLENEIRLMALDNLMMEKAYTMASSKLEALYKDMRITAGVRMECYDASQEAKAFLNQGHQALNGMEDAAGNIIKIE